MFARTCQECGHVQKDKEPDNMKTMSNAYCERKCKKCRSEALDYGHGGFEDELKDGKIVEKQR